MKLLDCLFQLFGMGQRRKLLYQWGFLSDAQTGDIIL
jgi:hypothetical protein